MAVAGPYALPGRLFADQSLDPGFYGSPNEPREDCAQAEELPEDSQTAQRTSNPPSKRAYTSGQSSLESKRRYDEETVLTCTYPGCSRTFNRASKLNDHVNTHTGDRPFKCSDCGLAYKKRTHLTHHVNTKHANQRSFQCQFEGCAKSFTTKQKLQNHGLAHINQNKHKCTGFPPCQRHFRKAATLQRHIEQDHLNPSSQTASGQDSGTVTPATNTIEKPRTSRKTHPCPQEGCSTTFPRKADIKEHLAIAHGVGKLFVCGQTDLSNCRGLESWKMEDGCGASYVQMVSLENHVRSQHLSDHSTLAPQQQSASPDNERNQSSRGSAVNYTCPGCSMPFELDTAFGLHLSTAHDIDEADIVEILVEQEALQGGRFWIGGPDDSMYVNPANLDDDDAAMDAFLSRGDEFEAEVPDGSIDPSLR